MTKTVTIEIPAPPPGYGKPVLGVPQGSYAWFAWGEWHESSSANSIPCIHALPETPWYPESWRNDMTNVHEVARGEWPPCKPGDEIQLLSEWQRDDQFWTESQRRADGFEWHRAICRIVAIRIIRRAGDA